MSKRYLGELFTAPVLEAQRAAGAAGLYGHVGPDLGERDALGRREANFIAVRDSFYMATNSASGWPYIQHRGGKPGFVRVLDSRTLAFADYPGNRQYVSTGNLAADDRASLFFMDYARKARLKLLARVRAVDPARDSALAAHFADEAEPIERVFVVDVDAYDWNCPKFITPRYTQRQVDALVEPLLARIAELEGTRSLQGS